MFHTDEAQVSTCVVKWSNHFRAKVLTNYLTVVARFLALSETARLKRLAKLPKAKEIEVKIRLQLQRSVSDS